MQDMKVHLGHCVGKQAVQQLVRVLPLHGELSKRRQVDHSDLLHHQLALSADWPEPVGASETGPGVPHRRTQLAEESKTRRNVALFPKSVFINLAMSHCSLQYVAQLFSKPVRSLNCSKNYCSLSAARLQRHLSHLVGQLFGCKMNK